MKSRQQNSKIYFFKAKKSGQATKHRPKEQPANRMTKRCQGRKRVARWNMFARATRSKIIRLASRGKRLSKSFERSEGTQWDVAELEVLRNCACSFLQYEPLSTGESMLATGDVARFYSGHRRCHWGTRNSELACESQIKIIIKCRNGESECQNISNDQKAPRRM